MTKSVNAETTTNVSTATATNSRNYRHQKTAPGVPHPFNRLDKPAEKGQYWILHEDAGELLVKTGNDFIGNLQPYDLEIGKMYLFDFPSASIKWLITPVRFDDEEFEMVAKIVKDLSPAPEPQRENKEIALLASDLVEFDMSNWWSDAAQ